MSFFHDLKPLIYASNTKNRELFKDLRVFSFFKDLRVFSFFKDLKYLHAAKRCGILISQVRRLVIFSRPAL
jgi:hypothetical protein